MKIIVAICWFVLLTEVYSSPVESVNGRKLNPEEVADQFEGDIVLPAVVVDPLARSGRNGITDKSKLWAKNNSNQVVVPYIIQGSSYSSADLSLIKASLDAIQKNTCVRFVARQSEKDFIEIVSKGGCSSAVGRVGGKQEVSLSGSSGATHCMVKGIIIHEVLHALGFYHMHSAPERDNYVKINYNNVIWGLSYAFSTASSSNLYGTKYDVESVMHYSPYYFTNNGKPTIEPIDKSYLTNNLMGQRVGLSSGDVARINKMYGC